MERLHLKPLPAWIPEPYRLHQRTVDVEGYVSVSTIRYSVPFARIGRRVEVRETRDKLEIELDARHIVTHERALTPLQQRITLLTQHLKEHKHDHHTRRGLMKLIGKQKRLRAYLRDTDVERYRALIARLGIRG